ncbi:MAG TPA: TSUP family transporter [Rhodospirillaceae bacterium]|nr:TSUP family transporter [Rhodospirillaceae bacterium]
MFDAIPLPMLGGLAAVAVLAGFVDSIAGGGGLLCVPALLAAGLSPAQTLATNKLQGSFGTFSASLKFVRAGQVDLRRFVPAIATTFLGAAAGSLVVQVIDPSFLKEILPFLLLTIALYVLVSPQLGDRDQHQRLSLGAFSLTLAPLLGFYDGFFGPGMGSLLAVALVTLLGQSLTKATAHSKVLNFTSNATSVGFFLLGGQIVWTIGLTMAVGQFIGARLGSQLVLSKGAKIIKPCLVMACLAITTKIVLADPTNPLHRAIVSLWPN